MPKRKNEQSDDYEKLFKKFKKLEKKLRRRCRSRSRSSDRSEYEVHSARSEAYEIAENNVAGLLDGNIIYPCTKSRAGYNAELSAEPTMAPLATAAVSTDTIASTAIATEPSTMNATTIEHPTDSSPSEELGSTEVILPNEILEILGEDPTISNSYGDELHKDLAVRLEHSATHGLTKELRKEFIEKYLLPSNCKLVDAPALNAEIKAGISDMTAKRDKSIEIRQKQIATAISCLGQVINMLITKSEADPAIVKMLMDTERILCDCQHSDSAIRRSFILSGMKKDMKDQLQNTKPDNLLFGQNLTETIKIAKAINKSGAELKTPMPKPQANTSNKKFQATASTSKNLNWKGPYPARKQPNYPKMKEPPRNRNRQSNSSKHSQQQRAHERR